MAEMSSEASAASKEGGSKKEMGFRQQAEEGGGKRRRVQPHLQRQLCDAVQEGQLDAVNVLLENSADPNQASQTNHRSTPLLTAAQEGYGAIVDLLLQYNANPNTPNAIGQTPLNTAVHNRNFIMAASLVAHGADPTTTTGASLSQTTNASSSLLYLAAEAGALGLVEHLLKCAHGVDPPTASGRADVHVTPIDIAKHNNHTEVVKLLTAAAHAAAATANNGSHEGDGATGVEAPLSPHITAILTAESLLLLPLPPAVLYWLQGGSSSTPSGQLHYDLAEQAVTWLVKVVRAAHLSPRIKQAGRSLMACFSFTQNLSPLKCWSQILIPQLTSTLKALGAKAKHINTASNLETAINTTSILAVAAYNLAELPAGHATPRDTIRQDLLMPILTKSISSDYKRDWKAQPEHIYVHVLLLIATALNPLFGTELRALLSDVNGVALHDAPIKSFARMINKLMTADDHRYVEQEPRPAMNIDIVRRLVSASTPEAVLELVKLVAARFGGLSHLKCLPELATTNPAAADARYHMLPVMITVVFAPRGVTVGSLLTDPDVRVAWAKLRSTRPSNGMSSEQWQLDHDTAVNLLETKCDPNEPARMHCEVQMVTTAMAEVQHEMHEVYKVVRASSGPHLHADVAKPELEGGVDVDAILSKVGGGGGGGDNGWGRALWSAALNGRITTVHRLLELVGGGGTGARGGGGGGGTGGGVDVNWQDAKHGRTAIWNAAQNGHLSVVLVLLEHGADPNIATTPNGGTPMCIAAQKGHFAIVKILLENNANPNQATTDVGQTPLYVAARKGYLDIVKELLEHNADPNQVRTTNGDTPLFMAAQNGRFGVVKLLLVHNARPNQARTDNGESAVYAAASQGHVNVVNLLLENNADPNQAKTTTGSTPLFIAAQKGHLEMITTLVDAGGRTGTVLTDNGATDLWAACWKGHMDVVQYLVSQSAVEINRPRSDARSVDGAVGHPGTTPLEVAVLEGHTAVVGLLKQHGAVSVWHD